MSMTGLIVALLLPALFGIAWLQLLWGNSHWAARIGFGYLLGIITITTFLRVWDSAGLILNFQLISVVVIGLSIIPFILKGRIEPASAEQITYTPFNAPWQKLVWFFLISILIIRYGGILMEIIWRPLYPWDAWMNWSPKAKTWFELKELVPFVSRADWAKESIQIGAYTLGNPKASTYPPLVPLIQTWTALGMGNWVDNLVNLPWALCVIALGLSFYGQGRMLGARPHTTMLITFLMLSIPYINIHTALAGYAELWLASFYCLTVMAFTNWLLTKNNVQAALTFIFALACIQTKEPGIIWAATLVPAIVLALLPGRWSYAALLAAIFSIVTWFYLGGISTNIPVIGDITITTELISLPKLGNIDIEYHPVGKSFVFNDLVWSNWHLLGWLILIIFIPVFVRNIRIRSMLAPSILPLCGFLFMLIIFFFTNHYNAALDNTTINRATIHMLPTLLYFLFFSYTHGRKQIRQATA